MINARQALIRTGLSVQVVLANVNNAKTLILFAFNAKTIKNCTKIPVLFLVRQGLLYKKMEFA